MKALTIAAAQFQPKDGDKDYNLSVIERQTAQARDEGAEVISFHEMSVTAYTFLKDLSRNDMKDLAESVPDGESTRKLTEIARKYGITLLAGLLELEADLFYNTYICVDKTGLKAKYRKLHPFISPYLSPGNEYVVFDLNGWKCSVLICYDNNVIENVRAVALMGTDVIFAPHVTMCTPSTMPGRGFVDDSLWQGRYSAPDELRAEFDGPKGMKWLLRWLPARAFDNGVYYVFTNPIGYDGEHLKNGNSLIMDPHGEVMNEIKSFEDGITIATLTEDKLHQASGRRYIDARRPELYKDVLGKPHQSSTKPAWIKG